MVREARQSHPIIATSQEVWQLLSDMAWFRGGRAWDETPLFVIEHALEWACQESPPPTAVLRETREVLKGLLTDWSEAILIVDELFRGEGHPHHWPHWFYRLKTTAAAEDRRARMILDESWPVSDEKEEAQALADVKGGKGLELEDAFADIAGVPKDEWMRRVAEHKKKQ
jgi:hypothetical protein